jgi:tripartite-type tricarboxylate transporter receptor subunit TctC
MMRKLSAIRRLIRKAADFAASVPPSLSPELLMPTVVPIYWGKTLRIIVPCLPAGISDLVTRLFARRMKNYIPGGPDVMVQNMPGAEGIIAMNYIYNVAKPDGLTIAAVSTAAVRHQLLNIERVEYDFSTFEYLGNVGRVIEVFVVRASLRHQKINDLKQSKTTITLAAGGLGSKSTLIGRILALEGYNVSVAPGYITYADRIQALKSGQADATIIGWLQAYKQAEVRPLFWLREKSSHWTDLPNLEELNLSPASKSLINGLTTPLDGGRSYVAPPKTPECRLEVLRKAIKLTVNDPNFRADAKDLCLDVHWHTAEETKDMFLKILNSSPLKN